MNVKKIIFEQVKEGLSKHTMNEKLLSVLISHTEGKTKAVTITDKSPKGGYLFELPFIQNTLIKKLFISKVNKIARLKLNKHYTTIIVKLNFESENIELFGQYPKNNLFNSDVNVVTRETDNLTELLNNF